VGDNNTITDNMEEQEKQKFIVQSFLSINPDSDQINVFNEYKINYGKTLRIE
jgi:hypothetical protein